jgi:predicted lipid carrier protein YhbT
MPSSPNGLCQFLARPLRWLPGRVHAGGLSVVLNRLLAQALRDGELDFLRGRVVALEVTDLGLAYRLRLVEGGFTAAPSAAEVDVRFSGDANTFLLLATQREDADSLFFQRLLRIEGDTALGLHLKNFLDALGEPALPAPARRALEGFADLYARRCGSSGGSQAPQFNPGRPAQ